MIGSKWWKAAEDSAPKPAVPAGRRVYAIGDIHGRADLLATMADIIARDMNQAAGIEPITIFLGDYVDRGSDSRGVIDRLARADFPTPIVTLRGNHEDILIGLINGEVDVAYHEQLGGGETLRSYGVSLEDFAWASPVLRQAMLDVAFPEAHCAFFDRLQLSETIGDYFFCHAGARPGVPLSEQTPEDLLWIRDEFLKSTYDFGKVIVHGHTPVREPFIRVNGIDIDTHAFATGVLTAIVLEGTDMRFLRTA